MKRVFFDRYGDWRIGWVLTGVFVGGSAALGLLVAALFAIILPLAYYAERADCHAYGDVSSRDVRFVHLVDVGVPLSWDCLVRTADGRWISRSQLRAQEDS